MPFKVQVGPPQIAIHHGQTVLLSEEDAQIRWPTDKGLYFLDTRVLSAWSIYANGTGWDLLNGGATAYDTARVHLTNPQIPTQDGPIPPRTLGLVISRTVAGGVHEDIDITNHNTKKVRFNLEVSLRSDFADIFEVKSNSIVRRGRIATDWSESAQALGTTYRNQDFMRAIIVRASGAPDGARAALPEPARGDIGVDTGLVARPADRARGTPRPPEGARGQEPPGEEPREEARAGEARPRSQAELDLLRALRLTR